MINRRLTKFVVGIRREDKSAWERRVPLIPDHIASLKSLHPEITFLVQPDPKRIFPDRLYAQAGAILADHLDPSSIILGIKEVAPAQLLPEKTYLHFAHVIKVNPSTQAQPHNMPTLDAILAKHVRLLDYEKITDAHSQRLIAFGKYAGPVSTYALHAGMAGALDFFRGLGEHLTQQGISTPLLQVHSAFKYFNLEEAKQRIRTVGKQILAQGVPPQLRPLILCVTGTGRTAEGCLEILSELEPQRVSTRDLPKLVADPHHSGHEHTVYLVQPTLEDFISPSTEAPFSKQLFYRDPSLFANRFDERVLPYISALFHCITWTPRFPRYITNASLQALARANRLRLLGISDITCDINGSIECLQQATTPDEPFFYFDPQTSTYTRRVAEADGKILYLAVDFLPCELAFDACSWADSAVHFSGLLRHWIPNLVRSLIPGHPSPEALLPELSRAVITEAGSLTPDYRYIAELRQKTSPQH